MLRILTTVSVSMIMPAMPLSKIIAWNSMVVMVAVFAEISVAKSGLVYPAGAAAWSAVAPRVIPHLMCCRFYGPHGCRTA